MDAENARRAEVSRLVQNKKRGIEVALGQRKADLVLKNASYVNVFSRECCVADIAVFQGRIVGLGTYEGDQEVDLTGCVVIPGLIDPHIHLESSMANPAEFAKAVLPHGTTTVVADPHEITNVMGEDGMEYMLQSTEGLPLDVFLTLPSCVPATPFDENGANIDYRAFASYYSHPRVVGLAEMMNYEGVCACDDEVLERIVTAELHGKVVDGHAPGLMGRKLNAYVSAGVYSDHENSAFEEAMEELRLGANIMIREGTAAHNLEQLMPLVQESYADRLMFCCDDKHPNDLLKRGHIDAIVRLAIAWGADPITAIRIATYNAAHYFNLKGYGAIACGYVADLVVLDSLENFNVLSVYKKGKLVYASGETLPFEKPQVDGGLFERAHRTFDMPQLTVARFCGDGERGVVGVVPEELVTDNCGYAHAIDTESDILKIAVAERHRGTGHVGWGYIKGYGLKAGAIATSISHDSHNLIIVGANEGDMAVAGNYVAQMQGGIAVVQDGQVIASVVLPVAGLMSDEPLEVVNAKLEAAKQAAFALGVGEGVDPFMTLSFMSLPVIPALRITTRGVFDVFAQAYLSAD
ncbi:MAG: adenine deaminase [Eggerthellaceae bacterium]|nr:adenine deaminase [Eggerthellaceae bacterium]